MRPRMAGESIRQTPSPTAGIWCPLLSASAVAAAISRSPAGRVGGLVVGVDKEARPTVESSQYAETKGGRKKKRK